MKKRISEQLVDLLSEITATEIELEDANEPDFLNGLALDSIAILRLTMEIERNFDIKIMNSELSLQYFSDFNKLVNFLGDKLDDKACGIID